MITQPLYCRCCQRFPQDLICWTLLLHIRRRAEHIRGPRSVPVRETLLLTHFTDEGSDHGDREVTWQQALALRLAARLCGLCCQAGGVTIHGQRTPALNTVTCVLTRGNVTCHEEPRRQEWQGESERQMGGEGGPEGGPPRARVSVAGQAGYDCLHPRTLGSCAHSPLARLVHVPQCPGQQVGSARVL